MRYVLVLVLAALLGLGFVMHEHKSDLEHELGAVASQLADRPVKVHCQGITGELFDVTPEGGSVQFDRNGRPSDTTNLKRRVCNALQRFHGDVASGRIDCVVTKTRCDKRAVDDVLAVHTLAHESRHLRSIGDESIAECGALQTTAQAAELLGADKEHADAAALYVITWFYPREPSEYRTATCFNGGPLDLRPADANWP
jgi:hypothetical protein